MRSVRRSRRLAALAAALVCGGTALGPGAHALAVTAGGASSTASATGRLAIANVTGWTLQAPASSLPTPTASDGIGPGSYLLITRTDGTFICTANFVWSSAGTKYLGTAGHCLLPSGDPTNPSVPDPAAASFGADTFVSDVSVCVSSCAFGGQLGGVIQGTFDHLCATTSACKGAIYARQYVGTEANQTDIGNDFGLVAIPAADAGAIRPTMPVWGGPTGSASVGTGSPVCLYGNGEVVGETFATKARAGIGMGEGSGTTAGAWFADIPSLLGDSGSAVENCVLGATGLAGTSAVGVLTHLNIGTAGLVAGTTVAQATALVASDAKITISLING